jgi:hypothetical protein
MVKCLILLLSAVHQCEPVQFDRAGITKSWTLPDTVSMTMQLHYFPIRSLGEMVRLVMAHAEVECVLAPKPYSQSGCNLEHVMQRSLSDIGMR